jgi:FAD/FMN-containing dehydrogenase
VDFDRFHPKSHYLSELPDEAIETIVEHTETLPGRFTTVRLGRMGGAINRIDSDAMAFPHRGAAHEFNIWGVWSDAERDEEVIGWVRTLHEALVPHSTGGVYVNQLNQYEQDRVRAAYGDNYDRLVDLKNEWDPENLFRKNQNIEPTT